MRARWLAAGSMLALAACTGSGPTSPDSVPTEREAFILQKTTEFSDALLSMGLIHSKVKGSISDQRNTYGCEQANFEGCHDTGWYANNTAYYYRPDVNSTTPPFGSYDLLRDIAAHEVCHAFTSGHGELHKNCIRKLGAEPTYAFTEGNVQ